MKYENPEKSAELVIGQYNLSSSQKLTAFTKWCPPEDGTATFVKAEAAVDKALARMGQQQITLMQCRILPHKLLTHRTNYC